MAKSDKETTAPRVVWQLIGDGMKPTQTPHWFIGRNPFERVLPPGASMDIRLGVAAGCVLLALPAESYIEVPTVIQPREEVVVKVTNSSQHSPLVIDDKQSLVRLIPLILPLNLQSEEG